MAGRKRRAGRSTVAVCAIVLALSVVIAGVVHLTASPGDITPDAVPVPQQALTGDAMYVPDETEAPGTAAVAEGIAVSAENAPGGSDASVPSATSAGAQVYEGADPQASGQTTSYIVSQSDPSATTDATSGNAGQATDTTRGLSVRVTAPQTSADESSPAATTNDQAGTTEVTENTGYATSTQEGTTDQGASGTVSYSETSGVSNNAGTGRTTATPASTNTAPTPSYVESPIPPSMTEGVDYVPATVLVNVDEGASADQVASDLASAGVESVDPSSVTLVAQGVAQVSVTAGSSVEDAIVEISQTDAVDSVQPDFIYYIDQELTEQDLIETLLLDDLTTLGPAYNESNLMLTTQQESEDATLNDPVDTTENQDATYDTLSTQSEDIATNDAYAQGTDEYLMTESESTTTDVTYDAYVTEGEFNTQQECVDTAGTDGTVVSEETVEQTEQSTQETQVEVEGLEQQDAAAQAGEQGAVAEPGELLETLSLENVVNDRYYAMQWGIESIRADQAWKDFGGSTYKVGVAVLDNGFDVDHEDLKDVIRGSYNAINGSSIVSNSDNTVNKNHGMHVLGIIGATANNNLGIAGVSNNAYIMPILVSDAAGQSSTSDIVKAYNRVMGYQNTYNIRVINMSLGMKVNEITMDNSLYSVIDTAFEKGIVTVCSAGNGSSGTSYINMPSDYAPIVSVINLDNPTVKGTNDPINLTYTSATDVKRASGSNFNNASTGEMNKDIAAPGTHILSTYRDKNNVGNDSNVPYGLLSGTSMAAPHVAGVLALMFSHGSFSKNATGAQQAVDILLSTANGSGFNSETGFGEVDAWAALNAIKNSTSLISGPTYVGVGAVGADTVTYSGGTISSSDSGVLSVSGGIATPVSAGQALLTSTNGGRKAVTVVGPIEGDEYVDTNLKGNTQNGTTTDNVTTQGNTVKYKVAGNQLRWKWSSSNTSLATINDDGVLTTGSQTGKVTLTATLLTPNPGGSQIELTKQIQIGKAKETTARLLAGTTVNVATATSLTSPSSYTWTSSNTTVASVDSSGLVTGLADGVATITASDGNLIVLTATITVDGDISKKENGSYVFTINQPQDVVYTGSAFTPDITVKYTTGGTTKTLVKDSDYTVTYDNRVDYGTSNITVKGIGKFSGTRTVSFKITKGDISKATIEGVENATYTGDPITQANLTVKLNGVLEEGENKDYTVSYKNNVNAGTATVTITGARNYSGSTSTTFTISKADASGATVDDIDDQDYEYDEIEPEPIVKLGGKTLNRETDYTVSYKDNVYPGEATVTVKFNATNYTGSAITKTFKIKASIREDATISKVNDQLFDNHKEIKPEPTVKLDDKTLKKGTDYTLSYKDNTEVGTATITVKGTGFYTDEDTVTFKIAAANLTNAIIDPVDDQTYTGEQIKPALTVTLSDGTVLNEGTDYTVTYTNNRNVGTAHYTITATATGNYTGTATGSFKIDPAKASGATITGLDEVTYTGSAITQKPTVKLNGKTLIEGSDYTFTTTNNVNVGDAKVAITFKGNYTGDTSATFAITPASITSATVSPIEDQPYTGASITPEPVVTFNNKELIEDTDYRLTYSTDTIGPGDAAVTITGINNFKDTRVEPYTIVSYSIADATISMGRRYYFDKRPVEPELGVYYDGTRLEEGTDYTVSYTNNNAVGTATVTVTGKGAYTGSQSINFEILAKSVENASVTLPAVVDYTGSEVTPKPVVAFNGRELVEGTDYVLSYQSNVEKGIATLTIQGIGDFEGTSRTVTFEIKELDNNGWTDTSSGQQGYVCNHDLVTGWRRIGNNIYRFAPNGLMQRNDYDAYVGNNLMRYCFSPNGALSGVSWSDPYQTYYASPCGNRLWLGSNGMYYRMNLNNGLMMPAYRYNPLSRYGRLFRCGLRSRPYLTMQQIMRAMYNNPYIVW